ncbi:hypothetical protein M0R45_026351 [Rubus argutus]|uniref:Uncharacterized protein n=1 Tax=Rubus argutus TaxID=59490 RepID=A0AAW1WYY5_RUBAR
MQRWQDGLGSVAAKTATETPANLVSTAATGWGAEFGAERAGQLGFHLGENRSTGGAAGQVAGVEEKRPSARWGHGHKGRRVQAGLDRLQLWRWRRNGQWANRARGSFVMGGAVVMVAHGIPAAGM